MGVEQNNFRHMLTGYLSGPSQTQHMFGIFPAALVAHTGLAGEERLKAFPLQIFQDGDGGNVRIPFTAGGVPVFSKNTRDVVHQFFACQRALPADLIYITKTAG
ncbi:hypothetical protein ESCOMMO056B1_24520 [Escherichia coli]|nr:hypothetical protein HMPREF1600_04214 [Escherichia coli 907715]